MTKDKKKVLIIGLGKSGISTIKLLLKKNFAIYLYYDFVTLEEKEIVIKLKNKVKFLSSFNDLTIFDFIIKNPGIKYNHFLVKKLTSLNKFIFTEPYIASKFFKGEIIAITGTNGKSTTATIIHKMLKEKYEDVHLVGNIGNPFSDIVLNSNKDTIAVLELSSFQLMGMPNFSPYISIILNIRPSHLDYHKNIEEYINCKLSIFNNILGKKNHHIIINYDDDILKNIKQNNVLYFSLYNNKAFSHLKSNKLIIDKYEIISKNEMGLLGEHNISNVLSCIIVAYLFEINFNIIRKILKSFTGVRYRLEKLNIKNKYIINDSKSTNVNSLICALRSMNKPVILISGGRNAKDTFKEIYDLRDKIKIIICYGESKKKFNDIFINSNIKVYICETLKEAVKLSIKKYENKDIILFSPGCQSFDQFKNFEERGKFFEQYIKEEIY